MKSVRPKKQLGQHFLTDQDVARRIADTVDACQYWKWAREWACSPNISCPRDGP